MKFMLYGLLALVPLASPPPAPDPYLGTWLLAEKDARVEITRQGETYTGRYTGFPDPAVARKKGFELGGVILKNMKKDGAELTGKVVDPESKKEYNATLSAPGANQIVLKVRVMGVTAHTESWTRVAAVPITAPSPTVKGATQGPAKTEKASTIRP